MCLDITAQWRNKPVASCLCVMSVAPIAKYTRVVEPPMLSTQIAGPLPKSLTSPLYAGALLKQPP